MALQPIDLQTLFTQMEKVGREQSVQKDGNLLHAVLQNDHSQKLELERHKGVTETTNEYAGPEKLNSRANGRNNAERRGEKKNGTKDEKQKTRYYCDPAIGSNLDITL
jgi:hypothetical protein